MSEQIHYQWVKVSDLQPGWHIHIDGAPKGVNTDYRIISIERVGENVMEITTCREGHVPQYGMMVLHRKPSDEVSVFGVAK